MGGIEIFRRRFGRNNLFRGQRQSALIGLDFLPGRAGFFTALFMLPRFVARAALVAMQQPVGAKGFISIQRIVNGLPTNLERLGHVSRGGAHVVDELNDEQAPAGCPAGVNPLQQTAVFVQRDMLFIAFCHQTVSQLEHKISSRLSVWFSRTDKR